MKYSFFILNLTIMLGSVELERPLPFILLQNWRGGIRNPRLPIDEWMDPSSEMINSAVELLCEKGLTVQIIQYPFQSHESERVKLRFVSVLEKDMQINIKIIKNEEKKTGIGRLCKYEDRNIFFMKNNKYEGILLFEYKSYGRIKRIEFRGILTNHLSYEDATKAVVALFGNSNIEEYIKEPQLIRICASFFQGLSNTLVQSRQSYFVRKISGILDGKWYLHCEGVYGTNATIPSFIEYLIILEDFFYGKKLTVTHYKERHVITKTETSWNQNQQDLK